MSFFTEPKALFTLYSVFFLIKTKAMGDKIRGSYNLTYKKLITPFSLLGFIFFLSGFSALIYQVAWQRILTLHYGVGSVSVTIIVSVYMFGLGLGGLLGGFLAEKIKKRFALYFSLEVLLGLFGLLSLPFLGFLGRFTAGHSFVLSGFYIFIFLCLPTLCMGITLPLLVKIFNGFVHDFLGSISYLYFVNTLGAAAGSLFASYYAISFYGLDNAIYIAAIIDFALAVLIFLVTFFPKEEEQSPSPAITATKELLLGKNAYFFVTITGFLAIGYEIVWYHFLGVIVKASPYAFSTILSIYLFGIAIGSLGMNRYLKKGKLTHKKSLFFLLQFSIGALVIIITSSYCYLTEFTVFGALTKASFTRTLHPVPRLPEFSNIGQYITDWLLLSDLFLWPIFFMFLPSILMGASFPLISYLALTDKRKEGEAVGRVYFFNCMGNVLGGVLTGFLLLPHLGTGNTLLLFSVVNILFGLFVYRLGKYRLSKNFRVITVLGCTLLAVFLFPTAGKIYQVIHPTRHEVMKILGMKPMKKEKMKIWQDEGVEGIVVTYNRGDRVWTYINGLPHGGRPDYFFAAETVEALNFAPSAENILIIGYGTGTITETALKSKRLKKLTLVELNSTLIKNLKRIKVFKRMLMDKKLKLVLDDGRRFLLRTKEKFDLILMDPLRSTTSYSNNLYSQEFFKLAGERLKKEGILMSWMDEGKVFPKTISSVFNYVNMYNLGRANNFLYIASNGIIRKDKRRTFGLVGGLTEKERMGISYFLGKFKYLGDKAYIKEIAKGFKINKDKKPHCEYYLGRKLPPSLL